MEALQIGKMAAARLKVAVEAISTRADGFLREGFALAGAASVVYGISLMHRPSAFIVAGLMLLTVAWGRAK